VFARSSSLTSLLELRLMLVPTLWDAVFDARIHWSRCVCDISRTLEWVLDCWYLRMDWHFCHRVIGASKFRTSEGISLETLVVLHSFVRIDSFARLSSFLLYVGLDFVSVTPVVWYFTGECPSFTEKCTRELYFLRCVVSHSVFLSGCYAWG
jgi:hypothetical protein